MMHMINLSSQCTTSGTNILYSLGNVGIGGIDPLYKFTVAGSTTMNGLLNVNAAISADNLYIVGQAGIAGSNDCSCKLCSKPPHT